ncbi:hypothetical protein GE061_018337 [Apolygus lucorum]|uniref:Phospholipase A2-like domain-containing protein n=1 Tax=Apolygus lucorum TaxID=248454 RepID=A0A8S9XFQ8_APOLU|nr:hypothetical protein GE061_018337 [Apolygus lucorum]
MNSGVGDTFFSVFDINRRGLTWPGYKYLGPLNPLPNGTRINYTDQIACEHDWAYKTANKQTDIRRADRKAIGSFAAEALVNGTYTAAIGAVGLSAKYLAESVTLPISGSLLYPSRLNKRSSNALNMSNNDRTNRTNMDMREAARFTAEAEASRIEQETRRAESLRSISTYHDECERRRTSGASSTPRGASTSRVHEGPVPSVDAGRYVSPTSNKLKSGGKIPSLVVTDGPSGHVPFAAKRDMVHSSINCPPGYKASWPRSDPVADVFTGDFWGRTYPKEKRTLLCPCPRAVERSLDDMTDKDKTAPPSRSVPAATSSYSEVCGAKRAPGGGDMEELDLTRTLDWEDDNGNVPPVGDWSGITDDHSDTHEDQLANKTDYETEINELMHNYGLNSFDEVKDRLREFHEWDFMRRTGQIVGSKTNPLFCNAEQSTTERVPEYIMQLGDHSDKVERWAKARGAQSVFPLTTLSSKEAHEQALMDFVEGDKGSPGSKSASGGASGAIPRASTPNPRPKAKKVKSLSKAAILDVDDLASELETELGAWELWASTPKNIDIGPAAKVGSLIDNLKRKVIDPLLRGYSDLVNELAFHRKISSGITRISSSMDQIDRIVGRFDGGPLHTEVEDESSKVIALGLVRLEQALLAKFDALSTKVDNVVDKTDKVQGKLEKVVREDITNLGRKIDVLNYKQKEVAENTAALGARSLLKQNTPKTSKDKTGKTKFASDKTDTDTDSKRKRPETDVDTDGDSDALWTPVTRKRRTNGGGLGGGGASPRLVTTAAEAPNPRTKKLTKKAKKRQKNLKIEYENILTNNKRRASIPKLPTLVISKPRPNEIPLGSELESDHSYRDALMSPKSLRREMRAVVDPGRLGLSVKGVVPLGVDKLKVTVTSEDQKEKLTRELRSHNFELREDRPRTRSLMVRIHRVDRTIPQEDVARMAFEQNPWVRELFKDLSEWKEEFIPSFRKGKRELDDVIWVTRVTSRVRDELLKRTFIFIGFDVCTISDFIDITQCRKCLGFGHPESKCRGQTVCSTCAGSHEAKACTAGNGIKVCHNCKSQGLKQINHSPCGLDCPVYMKVWRREMRAVGPL